MKDIWIVQWGGGFLAGEAPQWRTFATKRQAVLWARQAGVYKRATFAKTNKALID
jgi:hypothetical protein